MAFALGLPNGKQFPLEMIALRIREQVGRDLKAVGASYDALQVSVAEQRPNATPFKVSYHGLRNFKWSGAEPPPDGEFRMEYAGNGQWKGALGGMQFTVQVGQTDNFALPFVDDAAVIGEWRSVDFVAEPGAFNPEKQNFRGKLYLAELVFQAGGKTARPNLTWTKDFLIDHRDKTASRYEIREIAGQPYLFLEWKSGDVTISGMKPHYYVLEKKAR